MTVRLRVRQVPLTDPQVAQQLAQHVITIRSGRYAPSQHVDHACCSLLQRSPLCAVTAKAGRHALDEGLEEEDDAVAHERVMRGRVFVQDGRLHRGWRIHELLDVGALQLLDQESAQFVVAHAGLLQPQYMSWHMLAADRSTSQQNWCGDVHRAMSSSRHGAGSRVTQARC